MLSKRFSRQFRELSAAKLKQTLRATGAVIAASSVLVGFSGSALGDVGVSGYADGAYYGYIGIQGPVLWPSGGEDGSGTPEFRVWAEYFPGVWLKKCLGSGCGGTFTAFTDEDRVFLNEDPIAFHAMYQEFFLPGKTEAVDSEQNLPGCRSIALEYLKELARRGLQAQLHVASLLPGLGTVQPAIWLPRDDFIALGVGGGNLRDDTAFVYAWPAEVPAGEPRVLAEFPMDFLSTVGGTPDEPTVQVPAPKPHPDSGAVEPIGSVLICLDGSTPVAKYSSLGTFGYLTDYFTSYKQDTEDQTKCGDPLQPVKFDGSWTTTADLWSRFRRCERSGVKNVWGPLRGAEIDVVGWDSSQHVYADAEGKYQIRYRYPKGYEELVPAYARVRMGPFDPAINGQRLYNYKQNALWGAYENTEYFTEKVVDADGNDLGLQTTPVVPSNLTNPVRFMNFPINGVSVTANLVLANIPPDRIVDAATSVISPSDLSSVTAGGNYNAWSNEWALVEVAHPGDGDFGLFPGETTLYNETPPLTGPLALMDVGAGATRHATVEIDWTHRGLLRQIAQKDLLHTDLYIYESDDQGNPLHPDDPPFIERRGFSLRELHGLTPDPGGGGSVTLQPQEGDYGAKLHMTAWGSVPRGRQFKAYFINRVTGYMGSARLGMVSGTTPCFGDFGSSASGDTALTSMVPYCDDLRSVGGVGLDAGNGYVLMGPPNLYIDAYRKRFGGDDDAQLGIEGQDGYLNSVQRIGFEGAGLTSDEYIVLETTWLDADGTALPSSLPGFSGRLAVSKAIGGADAALQAHEGGGASEGPVFGVSPGKNRIEVLELPDQAEHYYLHVGAVPPGRCDRPRNPLNGTEQTFLGLSSVCTNFGDTEFESTQGGALSHRPSNYVPIQVPIYDEATTQAAMAIQAQDARNKAVDFPDDPPPTIGGFAPIYRHVYRPEFQFTTYDLRFSQDTEIQTVTDWSEVKGSAETYLDFAASLTGPMDGALTTWGQQKALLWAVGYGEIIAVADGSPQLACPEDIDRELCAFTNLDSLAAMTPGSQVGIVEDIAARLTPEDYLALQLYAAGDAGNVLFDASLGYPLVQGEVKPIELVRYRDMSRPERDSRTDSYEVIPITVNGTAMVEGVVLEKDDGAWREVGNPLFKQFVESTTSQTQHALVIDYESIASRLLGSSSQDSADGPERKFRIELRFTDLENLSDDLGAFGVSHIMRIPGELRLERVGEPIGQVVLHNVNLNDGSLRLHRTDLALPGAGPNLEFSRSYSNVQQDSSGVMGPGWSHGLDYRLVPLGTVVLPEGQGVPNWVADITSSESKIVPFEEITDELVSDQARELKKISVNGTVFEKDGDDWKSDPGRFATLRFEDNPCSSFDARIPSSADPPQIDGADLGCFVFTARDGTEYFYDEPAPAVYPEPFQYSSRLALSVGSNLVYRSGFADLGLPPQETPPEPVEERASEPTAVRLIRDRFDLALGFTYEEPVDGQESKTRRLIEVKDYGPSAARSCTLKYDDADSSCSEEADGLLTGVECLTGADRIQLVFCYDKHGYLRSAKRADLKETYDYDLEDSSCTPEEDPPVDDPGPGADSGDGSSGDDQAVPYPPWDTQDVLLYQGEPSWPGAPVPAEAPGPSKAACAYNLVRVTDEIGSHFDIEYGGTADLGLDALKSRQSEEIVDTFTYPDSSPGNESIIRFGYDGLRRTASSMRASVGSTTYTLNERGNPVRIEEPLRTTVQDWETSPSSDDFGLLLSTTVSGQGRSIQTSYEYEAGNVTKETTTGFGLAGSVVIDTEWGPFDLMTKRSERRSGVLISSESWQYTNGALDGHTDAIGQVWDYDSDAHGLVTLETAPSGGATSPAIETRYAYDGHGNLKSTNVGGSITLTPRNARGEIESLTDPNGNLWSHDYDANGRLVKTTLPADRNGTATDIEVHYTGRRKTYEIDRNGLRSNYSNFTKRHQAQTITLEDDSVTVGIKHLVYDGAGNVTSETDWKQLATSHQYDALDRRTQTTNRVGDVMTYDDIDILGNAWTVTDYAGEITKLSYDALGRVLTSSRQGCGSRGDPCGTVTMTYDQAGSGPTGYRITNNDEKNVDVVTDYDGLGRALSVTRGRVVNQWQYDPHGRVLRAEDAEGLCVHNRYNNRGFLVASLMDGGCDGQGYLSTYTHDQNGNIIEESSWPNDTAGTSGIGDGVGQGPTATTLRTYDGLNRVKTEQAPSVSPEHQPTASVTAESRYDGLNNLIYSRDTAGRVRTWQRDRRGLVRVYKDAVANSATPLSYASCSLDAAPAGIDTSRATLCYESYDENGNLTSVTNARGVRTTTTFDAEGRPLVTTEAAGSPVQRTTEVLSYSGVGNPEQVVENGVTHTYTYNSRHQVYQHQVSPLFGGDNLETTTTYDALGLVRSETVSNGSETFIRTYQLDANNHIDKVYYPDINTLEEDPEYDRVGNLISSVSKTGATTSYSLDGYHRVYETFLEGPDQPLLRTSHVDLNAAGNPTRQLDAEGYESRFEYDEIGRPTRTILPLVAGETAEEGSEVRKYTPSGAVLSVTAPRRNDESNYITSYVYDAEDRVLQQTTAGETTSYEYDVVGNQIAVTTPRFVGTGKKSTMSYDALNRLHTVTDLANNLSTYEYDVRDNLTSQTIAPQDGLNVVTEYQYDGLNRQRRMVEYVDGQSKTTRYDNMHLVGGAKTLVDANGRSLSYDYDHYGRRTLATYPDTNTGFNETASITWVYDDIAARTTVTESKAQGNDQTVVNSSPTWGYPVSVTQRGLTVGYSYDQNGNRVQVDSPAGETNYTFDARNRLETAQADLDSVTRYTYFPDGRPETVTYPHDETGTFVYNDERRVESITYTNTDGAISVAYMYDQNGNRLLQSESGPTWNDLTSYDYDDLDRLREYTMGEGSASPTTTSYQFAGFNRATETVVDTVNGSASQVSYKTYDYDSANRLKDVVESVQAGGYAVAYDYDDNGNTVSKVKAHGIMTRVLVGGRPRTPSCLRAGRPIFMCMWGMTR